MFKNGDPRRGTAGIHRAFDGTPHTPIPASARIDARRNLDDVPGMSGPRRGLAAFLRGGKRDERARESGRGHRRRRG